jgi:putative flippase GtrA
LRRERPAPYHPAAKETRMPGIDWRKHLSHDAHPVTQFIKYAVAGGVATASNIVIFFLIGWFLLPCLTPSDPLVKLFGLDAPSIDDVLRARRAIYANSIGFVISNFLAWLLNRWFVFRPGRHHVLVEVGLFYAVSGVSFVLGSTLMGVLIGRFGLSTSVAFGANIVVALLINYAMRKFVIFKG